MKTSFKLLTIISAAVIIISPLHQSQAQLLVVNGDFADLTGLSPYAPSWYGGVPAGWTGYEGALGFNVLESSPGNFVANLSTLTFVSETAFVPLSQAVGTVDTTGIITLTFNLTQFSPFVTGAGIFNTTGSSDYADWVQLVPPVGITTAGFQTLSTAEAIDAGTSIGVAFWSAGGQPGISDVDVTVVPEPSTYALLVLGATGMGAHLIRRRRR